MPPDNERKSSKCLNVKEVWVAVCRPCWASPSSRLCRSLCGSELPTGVLSVPIESLKPNPDQPRKLFTKADHDELTQSIRDKGVLQPILVRSSPAKTGSGRSSPASAAGAPPRVRA